MDKKIIHKWLKEKERELRENTPRHLTENAECKAYLQGGIKTLQEIINQLESGKFDSEASREYETDKDNSRKVVEQGYYRHFKGKWYVVEYIAKHTETEENLVIYTEVCNRGRAYARSINMFLSKVPGDSDNVSGQPYRFMSNTELGMSTHDVLRESKLGISEKLKNTITIWEVSENMERCLINEDGTHKEFNTINEALHFLYSAGYNDKQVCGYEFRLNEFGVIPVTYYTLMSYKGLI